MTFLIGLIVLFCGAVIAKEFAYLPAQVRRFSTMVHNHRTLARIISFLIVLVVKCLADSTVVSIIYKTTTGLGCIPLSGISDHCSLTFVQFIRSTILSGSVNYYALSCCLSGDLTKWSVQWERALHVVQGSYLATWFICLVGKVVVGWPKMISRQRFEGMTTISPRKASPFVNKPPTLACLILIAIPFFVSPPVPTVYYPEWDELPKWDNSYQRI